MESPAWVDLDQGETVVWMDRPRFRSGVSTLVTGLLWAAAASAFAYALADLVPAYIEDPYPFATTYFWWIVVGVVVAWAIAFLYAVFRLATTSYVLTNRTLYVKRGLLSWTVSRIGVDHVQKTTVRRSLLGTTLRYSAVDVHTTSSGDLADTTLRGIGSPTEFQRAIGEQLHGDAQNASSGGPSVGQARSDTGST